MSRSSNTANFDIQLAIRSWKGQVQRTYHLAQHLSPEKWEQAVAPGKNRGIYLYGHLIAINEAFGALIGMENRRFQHFDQPFIHLPDDPDADLPPVETLHAAWTDVHDRLALHMDGLSREEWMSAHKAVTAEEFAIQPYRNRWNVLLSRSLHLAYHTGQLQLLS